METDLSHMSVVNATQVVKISGENPQTQENKAGRGMAMRAGTWGAKGIHNLKVVRWSYSDEMAICSQSR